MHELTRTLIDKSQVILVLHVSCLNFHLKEFIKIVFLTFSLSLWVSHGTDHDITVSEAMSGVRVSKTCFFKYFFWFNYLHRHISMQD